MTPPSKIAKNDHISIKFNTHIKMATYREKMKKMAKIGQKMAKIGQKWQKLGIFVPPHWGFLDIFSKFNNFSNIFLTDKFDPGNERFKKPFLYKIKT